MCWLINRHILSVLWHFLSLYDENCHFYDVFCQLSFQQCSKFSKNFDIFSTDTSTFIEKSQVFYSLILMTLSYLACRYNFIIYTTLRHTRACTRSSKTARTRTRSKSCAKNERLSVCQSGTVSEWQIGRSRQGAARRAGRAGAAGPGRA